MKHIFYRIRHLSRRRRNRALAGFILVNLFLAFLIYSNLVTYPNTYIGSTNISGKTADRIRKLIETEQEKKPSIQVKNRTYSYAYHQMGIVIDTKRAIDETFAPNRKIFPFNLINFTASLVTKRTVDPPLAFTQDFDQFIADTIFNFNPVPDDVSIDPTTKSLILTENSETYRYDKNSLQSLLMTHFGQYDKPIYPMLAKVTNVTINQIADTNQRLAAVFGSPMFVYLDTGGSTLAVELKEEDIREATIVSLEQDDIHVAISIHPDALNRVITKRIRDTGFPIRNTIVTQNMVSDFQKVIDLRFGGTAVNAIETSLDTGPNTNGTLADNYIEVDISQQKMYLFRGGTVYKTYRVSTGLEYPTPVGQFSILNKSGLGFSRIYNVWMPYWMGFSYNTKLHAYFGIHELPYTITGNQKLQRPIELIGSPNTGGCIALAPGAAREVYVFADIGTPVYIYN